MIRPVAQSTVLPTSRPTLPAPRTAATARTLPAARSSFTPAKADTQAKLGTGASPFVALPSVDLGGPVDQPIQKQADAIAKELFLGKFQNAGGGDGEVWRTYQNGSVDGDVLGRVRGVWIGGAPWSQGSTFLGKPVVDAVMQHHLGPFLHATQSGDTKLYTFMSGTVAVDKAGKVSVTRDAMQIPADKIAKALGLGHYVRTGGGDGEVWRTYQKGTVDGDMFGNVRGVWMGGTPWSQGSTFLSKPVVTAAMSNHLGAFQSSSKVGDTTRFAFAHGTLSVDAKGKVSVVSAE